MHIRYEFETHILERTNLSRVTKPKKKSGVNRPGARSDLEVVLHVFDTRHTELAHVDQPLLAGRNLHEAPVRSDALHRAVPAEKLSGAFAKA